VSRVEQLFGIDRRSLTAFRLGLGALLLADLAYRALDFQAHYTDLGVLPRALYLEIFSEVEISWSLHLVLGSAPYTALLFGVAGVAALALLLGVHTRWAALGSWVLLVSLHNRQPLVLSGSDTVLRMLLFWSIFLPLDGPPRVNREHAEGRHLDSLELVRIDAFRAGVPISTLPREILWRVGPRLSRCGS
jgi:hypothetical protein